MLIVYIIILLLSTALVSGMSLRLAHRVGGLFNTPDLVPAGFFTVIAMLAFLTVVTAPPALLVGVLVLVGFLLVRPPLFLLPMVRWAALIAVAMLGVSILIFPTIAMIPPLALMVCAGILLALFMGSSFHAPDDAKTGAVAFIAALLPLLVSPLVFPTPHHIALDAGLMIAAWVGLMAAYRAGDRLGMARAPLALLLGWLMLATAVYGAWVCSLVSVLAWCGAIAYATHYHHDFGSNASRI